MRRLRTVIFWSHLFVGTTAGLVIFVMSATGAALALKPQILRALDHDVRVVPPGDRDRLAAASLLAAVRAAHPDATPASLTIERDRTASAAVATDRGTFYVDPYTGRVLGAGSPTALRVFRTLEDWHRWLGAGADDRAWARSITGACNIGFLALAISGLYLWWPRYWTIQHTRPILAFRRAATGRARDFNWHNVVGFWCAPAIIVMTATGAVLSYRWANDLLYRLAASTPPSGSAAARPAGAAPARGGRDGGAEVRAQAATDAGIDGAWANSVLRMPTWSAITMRMPNREGAPVSFTITDGSSWNAFARSQLTADAATGEVKQWQPYDGTSLGQKLRGWFRFAHTGELAGVVGQVIAGVASAGGALLVWTGLALALRRFASWARLRELVSLRSWAPRQRRGVSQAR
jgi:uncharacterized iron-regulated membrane protein